MTSSCSAKICIWYGDKENDPLNHVGAQYCDDQNEKLPLKTILKQAHGLKLNNLMSNIAKNFPNKTPTLINLSCRGYLRNKFCPRNWLIEDAQQSSVKRVARRSDPGLYDFKRQCFYCGKTCIEDKKHTDRKNVETVRTINTKIYTSTLEVCKGREDNCAKKQLLGISDFVAAETRHYVLLCRFFKTHFPKIC